MHRGYVKLWRCIEDSGLVGQPNAFYLYSFLLLRATHKQKSFVAGGAAFDLEPGQVIVGRNKLAEETGLSVQNVRTDLSLLKKLSLITCKITKKCTIVSISNWNEYQGQQAESIETNERSKKKRKIAQFEGVKASKDKGAFEASCKPIETHYGGYRFRSRLEARWAVFFDALGIRYEYEKEGYKLASGKYLPDFWLPDWKMWVEIKGRTPSECEQRLASELFQATSFACCIFTNPREYGRIFCLDSTESASGIFESSFAKWCWNTQGNYPCIAICDADKRHRTFHSLNFEADYSNVIKNGSCGVAESSFAIKNAIDAFNSARFEFGR